MMTTVMILVLHMSLNVMALFGLSRINCLLQTEQIVTVLAVLFQSMGIML